MAREHREVGSTRQEILKLLRHQNTMTATELSHALGIGTVGVRQHLELLQRDGLIHVVGRRLGVGRPSRLYKLTETAEAYFPKRYDRLALDALTFIETQGGSAAIDHLFADRQQKLVHHYAPRLANKNLTERITELTSILNEQGYMCELQHLPDSSFLLIEHNCPIDCIIPTYHQPCTHELKLYTQLLGVSVICEETIAENGANCRYRIHPEENKQPT